MGKFTQSRFAARLQEKISIRREESGFYSNIAELLPLEKGKRLLDIGTGTGYQLGVIDRLKPGMELYGLDLSPASIALAKRHSPGPQFDFRTGTIAQTDYPDAFFNIITCYASMSYWTEPLQSLNEIYRILDPKGVVILVEPHKEIDIEKAVEQIKENMRDKSPLRRFLAVNINKYGLRYGRKIGLKLYSVNEMENLIEQSVFGKNHKVETFSMQGVSIFMKIEMTK